MFEKFFQKSKKAVEFFVALELEKGRVGAAVFTIADGRAKVKGLSIEKYQGDWQGLIEGADLATSKAAGEIPLSEIKKAVFGLPPDFLEGDKISKDKLFPLKKLTSELELTPCGFVVIPEAINFYLEEKEGGPQTNILIGITKKELSFSLFRVGKLTGKINIVRSEYITADFEKALEKFEEVDIFPSKILLYDGGDGDVESVKEELLKYPWTANNKFLHFPKIEILPADLPLLAVSCAAASELTKNISSEERESYPEEFTPHPECSKLPQYPEGKLVGAGFTVEKELQETEVTSKILAKRVDPNSLGFIKEETEVTKAKSKFKIPLPKISLQKHFELKLPKFFPRGKRITLLIIALVVAFFLAVSGYILAAYELPKATLTLIVDPKVFEKTQDVSVNTQTSTISENENEIPGKLLTLEVQGTKTASTTGKKIIGDPAKGTVIIYNKTPTERTFDKSTKISAKNLVFTLDDSSTIPAATESVDGLKYGRASVPVTAEKIGPEGNLPSQTEFLIADFSSSSYSGRNEQAFSGGTSREVSSVSSTDQENLLKALSEELTAQAKDELIEKLISGEKFIEPSLEAEIASRKFSHEVGVQATELTLNLTMECQGVSYLEKDFLTSMEKILAGNIPEGFEFKPEHVTINFSELISSEDSKVFRFKVAVNAKLFPKIDTEKIKREVAGLTTVALESYMKDISNASGFEIAFSSPFSLFKNKLPPKAKNITIEVKGR